MRLRALLTSATCFVALLLFPALVAGQAGSVGGGQGGDGGGGTQYAEGTQNASPTGNVLLWRDSNASSTLRSASPANPFPVAIISGGGSGGTASGFGSAFPAQGTALGLSDGTNMQGARGFDLDSAGGVQYVLGVSLRLTGSGGSVEFGTNSNPIRTDPTGSTTQPVSGNVGITGTLPAFASTPAVTISGTLPAFASTPTVNAAQSGNWPVRTQDGSGNALTSSAAGSTRPLDIIVRDTSGNAITAFGGSGGTASNFTSAFPSSGTAAGFSDGTNMQGARVYDTNTGGSVEYTLGVNLRFGSGSGSVEAGTTTNPFNTNIRGSGGALSSFTRGSAQALGTCSLDSSGACIEFTPDVLADMHTGGTTQNMPGYFVGLPSASGAVVGGTPTNPFSTLDAGDPCKSLPNIPISVSVTTDTAIIAASSGNRNYICGGFINTHAAEIVSIWEGTGTACGTSSANIFGSSTEANGISFGATGGLAVIPRYRGLSTNVDTCVRISGSNRVVVGLAYVQAP